MCSSTIACRSGRGSTTPPIEPSAAGLRFVARFLAQFAPLHREFAQRLLLRLERGADLRPQDLLVEQVLDADAEAQRLVGVGEADPAARRPDRVLPQFRLTRRVEQHVVGHDQVRVRRDPQVGDADPGAFQPVDLAQQHARIDDDAVADHAGLVGVEDPRRDQVELELLTVADDRVARVVAALEADDRGSPLGEQIRDLALALVAPLGADYDHARHWVDSDGYGGRVRCGMPGGRARPRSGDARDRPVAAIVAEYGHFVADLGQP